MYQLLYIMSSVNSTLTLKIQMSVLSLRNFVKLGYSQKMVVFSIISLVIFGQSLDRREYSHPIQKTFCP